MSIIFETPNDIANNLALFFKEVRLKLNMSQKTLSENSSVSLAVVKKFENSGKISLESLLKLALVLDILAKFANIYNEPAEIKYKSMQELLKDKPRKRGRK